MESRSKNRLGQINLCEVEFPSDKVNIGLLRRLFPQRFDHGFSIGSEPQPEFFLGEMSYGNAQQILGDMLTLERSILVKGVLQVRLGDAESRDDIQGWEQKLATSYVAMQISPNMQDALVTAHSLFKQGQSMSARLFATKTAPIAVRGS